MSRLLEWTDDRVEQVRQLAAQGRTDRYIAAELGVERSAIVGIRWRKKIPTAYKAPVAENPPADFKLIAPAIGLREAARHYKACCETIRRWHKLSGTTPKIRIRKVYIPKPRQPKLVLRAPVLPKAWSRPAGMTPMPPVPMRADTVAAQAQLHLQRLYPVYRANVRDPRAPSDAWIVAGRRVDEAELIRMAERRGMKVAA